MEDDPPREAQKWIEDLSRGASSHGLETLNLKGLQAVYVQKGLIHCDLVVPDCVSVNFGYFQFDRLLFFIWLSGYMIWILFFDG